MPHRAADQGGHGGGGGGTISMILAVEGRQSGTNSSFQGRKRTNLYQMTGTNAPGQPVHSVLVFDKQRR
jgi:hypothetical protein